MKTCIIFNPVACGEKARLFKARIASFAGQCCLKPTTGPGVGRMLAAEALHEGFETIVAAGGDGTVNEVLNGIGDVQDGVARMKLGILPLGTVNVFAKEIGLPMDVLQAWNIVLAGRMQLIDLAAADFTAGSGQPGRRYFVQMAGAGMDARAIELVNWEQKKAIGPLAYVWAGLKAMRGPLPQIVVTVGTETCGGELVLVGNGRYYGGRFVLFPQADLADGILDVTIFPRVDWAGLARCGWNILTGQSPAAGRAVHLRGKSIQLASSSPAPFHVEGENTGHLPVTFSVWPAALQVIVP
ncbi:MAG: diacylglycerol kinase family lipid kinase [Verrucomicrobia bacterium]|nr:diacylglycerol kinase family lipid kinase [Verrucomicrobiota bacterium]